MSINFTKTFRGAAKVLSEEQLRGLMLLAVSTDCNTCKSRNCNGCTVMRSMRVINKADLSRCIEF